MSNRRQALAWSPGDLDPWTPCGVPMLQWVNALTILQVRYSRVSSFFYQTPVSQYTGYTVNTPIYSCIWLECLSSMVILNILRTDYNESLYGFPYVSSLVRFELFEILKRNLWNVFNQSGNSLVPKSRQAISRISDIIRPHWVNTQAIRWILWHVAATLFEMFE